MDTNEEKAAQARQQCRLVQSMANIIAGLAIAQEQLLDLEDPSADLVEIIGHQSHAVIDRLGDVINSLDAATQEDEETATPIFDAARRLFPLSRTSCQRCDPLDPRDEEKRQKAEQAWESRRESSAVYCEKCGNKGKPRAGADFAGEMICFQCWHTWQYSD